MSFKLSFPGTRKLIFYIKCCKSIVGLLIRRNDKARRNIFNENEENRKDMLFGLDIFDKQTVMDAALIK
jgi:hypothetical protein